ncbi:Crp/Fnr family transcriptional regulator [Oxynema aestuarii]|jgi:CRP/FNR family cyclic AMP-dependent transcriptional regulator|uniref:Crp/Fnr family transcriptional regulator n=1 Tax=Oxynema aestuarii AP17 TaxID=2064643 RepID=A0A6H1U311_9CYAN|nr:Crp/Fnr family transcriptional regulator [Oxynema aestuarii]QIZ73268.1 Crp/Fnr family transcriptional regulator [Oxynema aestuarii AP17]RMH76129.1 MAG: Crp/Fnr family transcriptional regulator [Cyanobacteria bacterium J007]
MQATVETLAKIAVFSGLEPAELQRLQPHARIQDYHSGEIVIHEGDRLPEALHALIEGELQVKKIAPTGKETILRNIHSGEIFAAPALFGDRSAPATAIALCDTQVLLLDRQGLLDAIAQNPELALRLLVVFNRRLQQLHDTVHGLVSERAIVRLARLILYFATLHGTDRVPGGELLKIELSYYRMARTVGITYEECVRLIKTMKPAITYRRGGKITIGDRESLEAIASGEND